VKLSEFEEQRERLACGRCGIIGRLEIYKQPNANGIGAHCPNCGSKAPLAPDIWFQQDGTKDHVRRMRHDTAKIWEEWGDHCSFCGKNSAICEILGIGLQAQHVWPIMFGGPEDGPCIPICARCQEMTRPLLLESRAVGIALSEL
jgi:hypothetical protein